MIPVHKRKKAVPLPKTDIKVRFMGEEVNVPTELELRKRYLSQLHGVPEKDIFIDRGNGVVLYRTTNGGWVTNPLYMGVETDESKNI